MPESNSSTEPRYVVGRLGRPHGLDGYIGLYVDEADLVYFEPNKKVHVAGRQYEVAAIRRADRGHHLRLVGIDTRELADEIRGNDVSVTERRTLEDDEYWPEDLTGLRVFDHDDTELGVVKELVHGAAQDRLLVDVGGAVYEIPFVTELVTEVDLVGGRLRIKPIPGLIEPLA